MTSEADGAHVISATFNGQLAVGGVMIALRVLIHGIGLFTLRRVVVGKNLEERFADVRPLH